MSTSKNFTGTMNNPEITLTEFVAILKALPNAVAGRA